jgi:hypothetical protein
MGARTSDDNKNVFRTVCSDTIVSPWFSQKYFLVVKNEPFAMLCPSLTVWSQFDQMPFLHKNLQISSCQYKKVYGLNEALSANLSRWPWEMIRLVLNNIHQWAVGIPIHIDRKTYLGKHKTSWFLSHSTSRVNAHFLVGDLKILKGTLSLEFCFPHALNPANEIKKLPVQLIPKTYPRCSHGSSSAKRRW